MTRDRYPIKALKVGEAFDVPSLKEGVPLVLERIAPAVRRHARETGRSYTIRWLRRRNAVEVSRDPDGSAGVVTYRMPGIDMDGGVPARAIRPKQKTPDE